MPVRDPAPGLDRRHRLDPDRDHMRESWLWIVPLPARGLAVVLYTWVDARGRAGCSALVFGPRLRAGISERVDDVEVPAEMDVDGWSVGPLSVEQEPPRRTAVTFRGERVRVDLTFSPSHPAYAYSSHPEPFPRFFADDRLEQSGWATGVVHVDGDEIVLDDPCHRDHSFGARHWAGTLHCKWVNFLAADTAVHVMDLHGYGRRDVRGYVHRDGLTAQITDAVFDYELPADLVHRSLRVRCTDECGRITEAALLDPVFEVEYPMSARLRHIDVVGAAEVAGVPAVAYAEMGWPPEYLEANRNEGAAR
jgi:hypothetical protein